MTQRWSLVCLGCACFFLSATLAQAEEPGRAQAPPAPITVADAIEMTQWADRNYAAGGSSKNRVGIFSPDGSRFVVVLKKGNLSSNTNEFSILLFETKASPQTSKPRLLVTMSSSSNREGIKNVKWLGDNETVVFLGENPGEIPQIYSLNIKSMKLRKLTSHPTAIVAYDISRSGDQIVFEAHPPFVKKISRFFHSLSDHREESAIHLQGNRIKIAVILRRSDARRAQVAGIAQPKNPVSTRRSSRHSACWIHRPASHGILRCASARHLRPRRCSVQDDLAFLMRLPCLRQS